MMSIGIFLSKIKSLGLDAGPFWALPAERRVRIWFLNSERYNRLYAERRADSRVIDLGCGPPANRALVRDEAGVGNYVGVDFDLKNQPDMVADIARMPFASNSLALVRASSVFEHTYNYNEILQDIYRVLRPGGSLFIETPFFLEFHGYPSDYFRYTHIAWQRILHDIGFRVIDCDADCGRGFFLTLTKALELGSFAFTGAQWVGLRFTLRALSRIAWRLRWLDKHYAGSLYAAVVTIAEKPNDNDARAPATQTELSERRMIDLSPPPMATSRVIQRYHTSVEYDRQAGLRAAYRARRRPSARALAWVKRQVKQITRRSYLLTLDGRTYRLIDELIAGAVYRQDFQSARPNLCGIRVLFATFRRLNTPNVIFRLKETAQAADWVVWTLPASALQDNHFFLFSFEPIPDSAGKGYSFSIESPEAIHGDAVGVWTVVNDPQHGMFDQDGRSISGQLAYTLQYSG